MYKMLVLDMDGTLLTNDKKISPGNREALKLAVEKGVKVVISTGRIFASARVFGEMIGVKAPIIASNGAYIREKDRDEVIYSKVLGEDNIRGILNICKKHGMYCHLFTCDSIYSEKLIYTSLNYYKWNEGLPEDRKVKIHIIDKHGWDDVINENKPSILKALFTQEDEDILRDVRQEMGGLDVEVTSANPHTLEIMHRGVTKGRAVEVLAEYYNIDRSDVICIGDSENDISMIEYAGLGIAMENGSDQAKKAASFVTLSNEEDGVAYAVEKFILK